MPLPEPPFDLAGSHSRCKTWRRRILEVSQQVAAAHVAPAFSCVEIVDVIYHALMRWEAPGRGPDVFLMSKGHGCLSQYVILEAMGVLVRTDLDRYAKADGRLGAHPDYGVPGIAASTGSLGHGLGILAGQAYADKLAGRDTRFFCLLGDGEMQEGSTWEAVMMIPNLGLNSVVAFVDYNDFQGLGRTSETHPHLLPLTTKIESFGWESVDVDGHDAAALHAAIAGRKGDRPFMAICRTIKGKGVSYMENVPIWHYRSPNKEEYQKALAEIESGT